ncbi:MULTISPECIES: polysaccharide biosynthesis protein [Sphingobacterium]|uniref:polysaccharide biosynthesis protein n=1 Tax=Sphingobacterium TaxID=28453 RepID=UPI00257B0109|nr:MULTISPECIES: nucleoside-diphosphate sugar epimerase/dehydratase [Sphingobacterium]
MKYLVFMNFSYLRRRLRKENPRWVVLLFDLGIVLFCYVFSNFIVNSFKGSLDVLDMVWKAPIVLIIYLSCFVIMQTYKGIVRQTGLSDAIKIFKTSWLAFMILAILSAIVRLSSGEDHNVLGFLRVSYGVLLMHTFFTMVSLVASRVFYRTIYESLFLRNRKMKQVLIFGASRPGLVAFSLLKEDQRTKYQVVAFVEDKVSRVGKRIGGLRIMDISAITMDFVRANDISDVVIAVENDDPERLAKITDAFQQLKIELKIMPPAHLLLNSGIKREIRPLKVEDLLGRKNIKLNNPEIIAETENKVILITGAAGSIGGELSRQIAKQKYKKLILLDQAESPLYDLQQSLNLNNSDKVKCVVGDVRDIVFLDHLFNQYNFDIVFHAAAYKHVPLMEDNPYEAIWTNVVGSKNLADLALKYYAKKFVMISTDKAINPTNVMGATKRAAEIYVSSCYGKGNTSFVITRFGNVLGSNGSVIPLFEKQMSEGGPLTLTHPDITRYFMTIPEACQLVQEAAVMGQGGEIFVFDMGSSVKIMDLAKRMIRLKGYRYPDDIDIKIVGLRPGEKIFEELLANGENTLETHHPKIMIAKINHENLAFKCEKLKELVTMTSLQKVDAMSLVKVLKEIVPEFKSQNSDFSVLDFDNDGVQVAT